MKTTGDKVKSRPRRPRGRGEGAGCEKQKPIVQCKSCPWRVGCVPERDIPNYDRELHEKLTNTIKSGIESLHGGDRHTMVCHYSTPLSPTPCAGWLHNQLGPGNNLGLRLRVMTGSMPPPIVDGEQHERFEDTLSPVSRAAKKTKRRTKR